MPMNFWSFVLDIVKGSWAKVDGDIFTNLKKTGLQIRSNDFLLFLYSELEKNFRPSNYKTCHFKAIGDITTNFGSGAFDIKENEWPKVSGHN